MRMNHPIQHCIARKHKNTFKCVVVASDWRKIMRNDWLLFENVNVSGDIAIPTIYILSSNPALIFWKTIYSCSSHLLWTRASTQSVSITPSSFDTTNSSCTHSKLVNEVHKFEGCRISIDFVVVVVLLCMEDNSPMTLAFNKFMGRIVDCNQFYRLHLRPISQTIRNNRSILSTRGFQSDFLNRL